MAVEYLFVGILLKELGEECLHFDFVLAEPVDAERCLIMMFVEPTCGIGEDGKGANVDCDLE